MKYLEVPLNKSLSHAVCEELKRICPSIELDAKELCSETPLSFHELSQMLIKNQSDLFFWDTEDVPDSLENGLDFFFIPEIAIAVIFPENETSLQKIRNFYSPPVSFVGGGPGNHEWLTLEAKIILDQCDIVFYDALVNPLIVASLPDDVQRYYVGKRGDSRSFNQDTLNLLIANHAKRGMKVGRLKGGDSGIFGRITEEIDTLLRYGMSFHVVPGISAMQSISCCTGIFLTQRGISDRVTLTTARSAGGAVNELQLCKSSTLIVYMGILSADKITSQLLDSGYDEDLPAAVLLNLTRSGQRVIHSTLGNLAQCIKDNNLRPPGLLVFGNVTSKDLQRLPAPSPLMGRKVLLPSTEKAALKAGTHIRRWGGTPIFLYRSLLEVDGESLIPEYDDVIFFSPQEVSDFYQVLKGANVNAQAQVISIGKEVDSTFSCLFRKNSTVAIDHRDAVTKLRFKHLENILK